MVAVAQLVRASDCGSEGFAGSIPVSHPIFQSCDFWKKVT